MARLWVERAAWDVTDVSSMASLHLFSHKFAGVQLDSSAESIINHQQ